MRNQKRLNCSKRRRAAKRKRLLIEVSMGVGSIVLALAICIGFIYSSAIIAKTDESKASKTTDAVECKSVIAETTTEATTEKTTEQSTTKQYHPEEIVPWSDNDIILLSKTVYGEANGIQSKMEKSAVVWCILNRVDSTGFPNSIQEVITQPYQFDGYSESHPVTEENKSLVKDVLVRWLTEKNGCSDVGRTLPDTYLYFLGDGEHNNFTIEWQQGDCWNWNCSNPYES